ncbi:hypothetical protein B6N60_00457 [Richelia sinica FACHB-800]|uniref:Uncharacterized protein n=1 Tax=Richelia sinica FACHB-800 TaxID=1357546 RepID=A0A975Y353_9NOST|nr:hypothetical protein B6N60_00457 [Richelia sinica FACHB-800]
MKFVESFVETARLLTIVEVGLLYYTLSLSMGGLSNCA